MTTPAAQLKVLMKKRASIKSSVNSISNYVKKFNKTHSIRQLQIRLTSLNQYIIDFNNTQQSIQNLDIGEEEEDERLAFEESYYTLVAEIEDLIAEANSTQISRTFVINTRADVFSKQIAVYTERVVQTNYTAVSSEFKHCQ
ncbi:hypothetical protein ACI65C_001651 [Semiaphis heraclei]